MLRSLLFVPADRPERFAKAAGSGADAIILDLVDSVAVNSKPRARDAVADQLSSPLLMACCGLYALIRWTATN